MSAYVHHSFKKAFILNEEHLRKIHEIVSSRLKTSNLDCEVQYKVYRADDFVYTTKEVQDVIAEENNQWKKIIAIDITARKERIFTFRLVFSKDGAVLEIDGEDRDSIYLLSSDIKQYLNSEITIIRTLFLDSFDFIQLGIVFFLIGILITSMSFFTFYNQFDYSNVNVILENDNITDKLNYLIERTASYNPFNSAYTPIGVIMVATGFIFLLGNKFFSLLPSFFISSNIFLLGKENERFSKLEKMRSNLFWGVVVALVVGIVGSIITYIILPK